MTRTVTSWKVWRVLDPPSREAAQGWRRRNQRRGPPGAGGAWILVTAARRVRARSTPRAPCPQCPDLDKFAHLASRHRKATLGPRPSRPLPDTQAAGSPAAVAARISVSYTHLTLPTIYSV